MESRCWSTMNKEREYPKQTYLQIHFRSLKRCLVIKTKKRDNPDIDRCLIIILRFLTV